MTTSPYKQRKIIFEALTLTHEMDNRNTYANALIEENRKLREENKRLRRELL